MGYESACVLVTSYQAMGESSALQNTDLVCVARIPYTPLEIGQLIGRVWRRAMQRIAEMRWYYAEHTADERVMGEIVAPKIAMAQRLFPAAALHAFMQASQDVDEESLFDSICKKVRENEHESALMDASYSVLSEFRN
jgi:hypothetical protein